MTREEYINILELDNAELKKENQELKSQLSGTTFCYDEEEHRILKKQLEEANEKIILLRASEPMLNYKKALEETQQKEFKKYLEDEIKQNTPNLRWKHYNEDGFNDYDVENPSCIEMQPTNKILKEILQKYKEIVNGTERN